MALLLAAPIAGLGLDPGTTITQYGHTAWRVREGHFAGPPSAVTQTSDGFLWIGTEAGLIRFDGVRFMPWKPPAGSRHANYDRLLRECSRGGLSNPRIVQEVVDQATMLSLVSCGLGVAFVTDATRWRCPKEVVLRRVDDLRMPLTVSCIWRKDNESPLLTSFLEHVRNLAGAPGSTASH